MKLTVELNALRRTLIRLEETIIFALIERAKFPINECIYQREHFPLDGYDGSLCDFLLYEVEKAHSKVRRYTSPDEHPFFSDLPAPVLPPMEYPDVIMHTNINFNERIYNEYKMGILPRIVTPGDDQNYGASATCDVTCLQAISKRIHYGKFVAESKFLSNPELYTRLILEQDGPAILEELTDRKVEQQLIRRVLLKAQTYGQELDVEGIMTEGVKVKPEAIADIYESHIIPLTKEVEVVYLLERPV